MSAVEIRIALPSPLRVLAGAPAEVRVAVSGVASIASALDALEGMYPALRGAIRDHVTKVRRPLIRFFVCQEDWSHEPPDCALPERVITGKEPLMIVGAIAGG